MNPQQFQNMGMGRGMPMQMNPNFSMNPQQMNQMGGQQMPMQGMQQHTNVGHPSIQKHIFNTLQSQGPFSGWQATVNVNERAAQIKLIVDSLRLVRPPVELVRALEVAIQFERKCFGQSSSKEEYIQECNDKLGKIRDQRAQQMSQGANNMQSMQGMQMPNQNFQMQMGQNMMGQQNMAMNMPQNMQQMQQSQMMAQRNMQMANQPQMMQNQGFQAQQPQQTEQPKQNKDPGLSAEDNQIINQRAADLAKNTPKEKIRTITDGMAPQLRANLARRGVEPILYYFRMMATREFRKQQAGEGNVNQMQQMQNQQNQQQPGHSPYVNEMGRFAGQQAEGLRSQETGEMVVPASNNNPVVPDHMRIQQQMLANSQRMGPQSQNGMNPNYAEQQRRLQQNQKMQQAARMQAQPQENARAQATQGQPQMQQQGGAQASNLNRPANMNVQGVSPQPGSRPQSRPQGMAQSGQMPPGQQPMNMQQAQQREAILARYSVPVQNVLRQKPMNEWQGIIHTLQQQQNSAMQRSDSQQPQNMQRQQSAQVPNGAFLGGANIGTPMQQSLSTGAMGAQPQQQNPAQMNPEMLRQRQAALQQQQQQRMQGQAEKPQGQPIQPLNNQQMNFMDSQPIAPNVLAAVRSRIPLPQEIATWMNLKQWAMNNPIPNMPMNQLMQYQAQHFLHVMRARQQQQQAQQQQAAQQGMPQGQMMNMPGQAQAFPQPQIPNPTDQDIQRVRAQNPRLQAMSDEAVRNAIINRHRQQLQAAAQRQGAQGPQRPNMQPGQMQSQQMQQVQQPPPPQQQQPQKPQPQKQQPQQPARPASQTNQSKPPQTPADKGIKRPNEPVKTDGPTPIAKPAVPQRIPNLTKEQFFALPPDKRKQYVDQQTLQKLIQLVKEVQATMPKLQPLKLDAAAKQRMIAKLTEDGTKKMVDRFDQLLMAFAKASKDEAQIRGLVLNKLQLFSQYDGNSIQSKAWLPAEHFTITPEKVDEILKDLATKFNMMTAGIQQRSQLTPENLNRLQEQENRKKSIKGGKDVPPAPTTTQPPFQFGDNRGHGAPKYGGTGLKQEDLKLDPKRRKKNPPGGQTPVSLSATPEAASPQVTKSQPPAAVFRCPIPSCERNKQGFFNQVELDKHTNAVHKIDTEPVTDPLAFLDASLRDAFNLDENFKQIRKTSLMAPPMEKTASKGSVANLKADGKVATPPSQSGRPQSAHFNKDDMGLQAQASDWEHTKITLEELNNIFGDMDWEEAVPAAALELQDKFIEQYQQSEEWQKLIRTPGGSLTDTTTEKSATPAIKEPDVKPEDASNLQVDLEIEGLDLSGLEDLTDFAQIDTTMAEDESSPFEVLDKPVITAEQQFLLDNDIDYTRPDALTVEQKRLMDFIVEPMFPVKPAIDHAWEEIDWEAEERQRQEDIRLGTPGAWNGNGFNRFP